MDFTSVTQQQARAFINNFKNASNLQKIASHGRKVTDHNGDFGHASFNTDSEKIALLDSLFPTGTIRPTPNLDLTNEFRILIYPGLENDLKTRSDIMMYTNRKTSTSPSLPSGKKTEYFKLSDGQINYDLLFPTIYAYSWICQPRCQTSFINEL